MTYKETTIPGVWIIEPKVFTDQRGYFFEAFKQEEFDSIVGGVRFVQDNESRSTKGVLRGLHYQLAPYAQSKLVRVIKGRVLDVAVDIRRESPTYGRYVAVELSDENKRQLFIPQGFAHGFHVPATYSSFLPNLLRYNPRSLQQHNRLPFRFLYKHPKDPNQIAI